MRGVLAGKLKFWLVRLDDVAVDGLIAGRYIRVALGVLSRVWVLTLPILVWASVACGVPIKPMNGPKQL